MSTKIGAVVATVPETTMGVVTSIIAGSATLVATMTDMAAAMPAWTMIGNVVATMTDGPLPRISSTTIRQERQLPIAQFLKEMAEASEVVVVWHTMLRMRITAGSRSLHQVVAQE